MLNKIAKLEIGNEITVKNIGWNANKVISTVNSLQIRYGLSYLVGSIDGDILIRRVK